MQEALADPSKAVTEGSNGPSVNPDEQVCFLFFQEQKIE
jgi:hypothetical protein